MRALVLASLLAAAAATAQAQQVSAPQQFGNVAAPQPHAMDAAPAPMIAEEAGAGSVKDWYARENRPALVVYLHKKLDNMPPGWRGGERLLIEDNRQGPDGERKRQVTIGVQEKTEVASAWRNDFLTVFEQSIQNEMKRQQYRVLDSVVLHRKQAAGGAGGDIEYESLRKSARFIFEVQLAMAGGELALLGVLKDIHNGTIAASVRVPVDSTFSDGSEMDRVSRELVNRLSRSAAI